MNFLKKWHSSWSKPWWGRGAACPSWGSSKLPKHPSRTASKPSLSSTRTWEKWHSEAELIAADFWHPFSESELCLNMRKKFFTLRVMEHWNSCPGRLWSLLWRYSRPSWTRSCAACSGWPCFSRGVGLDDPQRSLPILNILWFCDSVVGLCISFNWLKLVYATSCFSVALVSLAS